MNPVEECLEMRKQAQGGALGKAWQGIKGAFGAKELGEHAARTAVGVGVTAGMLSAIPAAQSVIGAINQRRNFSSMMESNPDLESVRGEDPKFFNQAFKSLRKANPDYASDPLIAGTMMRRMVDNREAAGGILAEAMRGRADPGLLQASMQRGVELGAKPYADSVIKGRSSQPKMSDPMSFMQPMGVPGA